MLLIKFLRFSSDTAAETPRPPPQPVVPLSVLSSSVSVMFYSNNQTLDAKLCNKYYITTLILPHVIVQVTSIIVLSCLPLSSYNNIKRMMAMNIYPLLLFFFHSDARLDCTFASLAFECVDYIWIMSLLNYQVLDATCHRKQQHKAIEKS